MMQQLAYRKRTMLPHPLFECGCGLFYQDAGHASILGHALCYTRDISFQARNTPKHHKLRQVPGLPVKVNFPGRLGFWLSKREKSASRDQLRGPRMGPRASISPRATSSAAASACSRVEKLPVACPVDLDNPVGPSSSIVYSQIHAPLSC
jgi:hypothetical protein